MLLSILDDMEPADGLDDTVKSLNVVDKILNTRKPQQ